MRTTGPVRRRHSFPGKPGGKKLRGPPDFQVPQSPVQFIPNHPDIPPHLELPREGLGFRRPAVLLLDHALLSIVESRRGCE